MSFLIHLVTVNIVLSLLIFQTGFLLKRQEIASKSECKDAKGFDGAKCWLKPQVNRVILVLIDALRYDFLLDRNESGSYYLGKMKNVNKLVKSGSASIGTLLADPPTTTLQRIKAISTGTLPTFIDAGENFSPDVSVNEDSFIYQAKSIGLNTTLLGDNTWLSLYSGMFDYSVAFESFDIHDLDSIDDAIRPILNEEIKNSNSNLVIAHFLGVDHCGHKYGPVHPIMEKTLRKMDDIISETVSAMKSDDMLMVIGDHGMTQTGDHGGESEDETRAGIMVYSKNSKLELPKKALRQIDIVPTISLLLGMPIPFSNLGTVIKELLVEKNRERAIGMNYEQIKRFAEVYSTRMKFDLSARDANSVEEQLEAMQRIQSRLRSEWTQFNNSYINTGIFSLIEAILFLISQKQLTIEWLIFRTGCVLLQMAMLLGKDSDTSTANNLLLMALSFACISYLIMFVLKVIQSSFILKPRLAHLGYVFIIIHSISFFSNSFVVYESFMIRYLLQSLLISAILINHFRNGSKKQKYALLLATVLVRLEPLFHKCREEEIECVSYYPSTNFNSLTNNQKLYKLVIGLAAAFGTNALIVGRLDKQTGSIKSSPRYLKSTSWIVSILLTFYAFLNISPVLVHNYYSVITAQIVYMISLTIIVCGFIKNNLTISLLGFSWICNLLFTTGHQESYLCLVLILTIIADVIPTDDVASLLTLTTSLGFYMTGHSPVIPSIPWNAAFVGVSGSWGLRLLPAALVLIHLNVSSILTAGVLIHSNKCSIAETIALHAIRTCFTCLAASVHRRHLMVWKIFAPKFIFETVSFLIFILFLNILMRIVRN